LSNVIVCFYIVGKGRRS